MEITIVWQLEVLRRNTEMSYKTNDILGTDGMHPPQVWILEKRQHVIRDTKAVICWAF